MSATQRVALAMCLAAYPAGGALAGSVDEARARSRHTSTIDKFFGVMAARQPPTIAEFEQLFGPHNEDEVELQLRFEGIEDPRTAKPNEDVVARVNKRLLAPGRNRSLFLCLLGREIPDVRLREWSLEGTTRNKSTGEEVLRVRVGRTRLSFSFPIDEHYIGALLDDAGKTISAERFLSLCRVGDCCKQP